MGNYWLDKTHCTAVEIAGCHLIIYTGFPKDITDARRIKTYTRKESCIFLRGIETGELRNATTIDEIDDYLIAYNKEQVAEA